MVRVLMAAFTMPSGSPAQDCPGEAQPPVPRRLDSLSACLTSPKSPWQADASTDYTQCYAADRFYHDSFRVLHDFFVSGELCDVELSTAEPDSSSIHCHRVVLAAASPYFRAMFTRDMLERNESRVSITGVTFTVLRQVVTFAYTAHLDVCEENVQSLLSGASLLQMTALVSVCIDFLQKHLRPDNCLGIAQFADHHNYGDLTARAELYARSHFVDVVAAFDEFVAMTSDQLTCLLTNDDVNVTSENQCYEAVMLWTKHDPDKRAKYLPQILEKVRLSLICPRYLIEVICKEALLRGSFECRDLLDEAKNLQITMSNVMTDVPLAKYVPPRHSYAGVILCVGGRNKSDEPFSSAEFYDLRNDCWHYMRDLTTKRSDAGVVFANGKLMVVGGHDGIAHLNTGEMFDPVTKSWQAMADMKYRRRGLALASLSGAVYAVGGLDDDRCFAELERYDIEADCWTDVQPMKTPRGGIAVATVQGLLYAVGGNDGSDSLQSCERYDPHLNRWTAFADLQHKRAGAGLVQLHGCLYAAGGFDGEYLLDSVECYCPSADCWTSITCMTCPRGGAGFAVLANRIYAVGGHDSNGYLKSVERYDPQTEDWTRLSNMQMARAGCGLVYCSLPTSAFNLSTADET